MTKRKKRQDKERIVLEAEGKLAEYKKSRGSFKKKVVNRNKYCKYQGRLPMTSQRVVSKEEQS